VDSRSVIRQSGLGFADLDRIAATTGPGSFTGLRVGLSAARGIALAADRPVVGAQTYGFNTNSWQPSWTLSPGVYCNGLSISNGATAAMNPGVYFIDRGTFAVGGGAHVTGTGVTIVLSSSTGGNYANAVIDNGTTVTLSAPTTGATAGMVFYGDRRASVAGTSSTFAGGTAINFTGAIYLPTQTLNWNNGANNTSSSCTELIAATIVLGGANLQINCPTGVVAIGATSSSLVE